MKFLSLSLPLSPFHTQTHTHIHTHTHTQTHTCTHSYAHTYAQTDKRSILVKIFLTITAAHCFTLQHTATNGNRLQHTAIH